ncbi:radical SAM protein [Peptoniphilus indolicus]|uniref:radical SAM protein n=1 Tax=Peptoniphilus indolicus TaxID=33030 RepID=UPI0027956431|nr:radical SAM protein [Peptoniphilus indolicus]
MIPIFVPHEGCPNDCVFCNQRKITGISTSITEKDIRDTIETYSSYFKNDNKFEIALYGGSFTAIDIDTQEWILKLINKYIEPNRFDSIRLSTRPDAIDEKKIEFIKKI